jgi:F0F1-type ATP synthase assembly protein I
VVALPSGFEWPNLECRCRLRGEWESDVAQEPEQRSVLAVGVEWASRVSTVVAGFLLPAIAGFLLDRWLQWGPVFTLVGVVLGFVCGLWQILAMAREIPGYSAAKRPAPKSDSKVPLREQTTSETEINRPGAPER